jgi:hypothetical protein
MANVQNGPVAPQSSGIRDQLGATSGIFFYLVVQFFIAFILHMLYNLPKF